MTKHFTPPQFTKACSSQRQCLTRHGYCSCDYKLYDWFVACEDRACQHERYRFQLNGMVQVAVVGMVGMVPVGPVDKILLLLLRLLRKLKNLMKIVPHSMLCSTL